jgi:hypothetical protein
VVARLRTPPKFEARAHVPSTRVTIAHLRGNVTLMHRLSGEGDRGQQGDEERRAAARVHRMIYAKLPVISVVPRAAGL